MKIDDLEERVLNALRDRLINPELCKIFCEEYTTHVNQLRIERNASLAGYKAEFEKNDRELEKLVDAICDGVPASKVKGRMEVLTERQEEMELLLDTTEEAPVLIHPNMAHRYHEEIRNLLRSLNEPEHREQSAQIIRRLIEKVVLSPKEEEDGLIVDLHGDLAGILLIAEQKRRVASDEPSEKLGQTEEKEIQQVKLVAGAHPKLNLLFAAFDLMGSQPIRHAASHDQAFFSKRDLRRTGADPLLPSTRFLI